MKQSVDNLSHTTLIDVLEQIFDYLVFIGNKEGDNLLLLTVDEKLDNFAEIAGENRIDFFTFLDFDELEKSFEQHVFADLLRFNLRLSGQASHRGLSEFVFTFIFGLIING